MTSFFPPAIANTLIQSAFLNDITDSLSTVMSGSFAVGLTVNGGITANGTIVTVNQPLNDYSTNVATTQWVKEQGYALFVSNSVVLPAVGTAGIYNLVTTDAEGRVTSGTLVNTIIDIIGDVSGSGTANIVLTMAMVGTVGTYTQVVTDSKGRVVSGSGISVTPGTYNSVVVDQYGRVTNGSTSASITTPGTYNSVIVDQYGRVTNGVSNNYLTNSSVLAYSNLPSEVQVVPLAFGLYGQPPSYATIGISIIQTTSIVANFVGSQSYCQTTATSSAVFNLGYIRSNINISLGTVTFAANSHTATFSGSPVVLMAGDWLYLTAPATIDPTLSTISVTLMGQKV